MKIRSQLTSDKPKLPAPLHEPLIGRAWRASPFAEGFGPLGKCRRMPLSRTNLALHAVTAGQIVEVVTTATIITCLAYPRIIHVPIVTRSVSEGAPTSSLAYASGYDDTHCG